MFPRLGSLVWPTSYGLALALAGIACWWLARRRAQATGLDPSHVDLALPLAFAAGALLAAAAGWFVASEIRIAGNEYLVPGRRRLHVLLLVALPTLFLYCRVAGLSFRRFADVVAVPALVFIAALRVGCFLAGCCFGDVVGHSAALATIADGTLRQQVQTVPLPAAPALPWAVRFPAGSFAHGQHRALELVAADAPASLPVHPVQLYESLALLLASALLITLRRRLSRPGDEALLALAAYSVLAFLWEFLRADNALIAGPLTLNQLGHAGWLGFALWFARRRATLPAPEHP